MMNQTRMTIGATLILGATLVHTPAMAVDVYPGQLIQAAVDATPAGGTVTVHPGIYHETAVAGAAVTIKRSLTLEAATSPEDPEAGAEVILEAMPGQNHGILAEGTPPVGTDPAVYIDGFTIKGFTVRGFPNNGIYLRYVKKYTIENNVSANNLENGIFPTLSADGLVKNNVAYGSDDSALWVEASTDVRVIDNELYNSVTGLEVTVSTGIEMTGNHVYNNTTGVGLYHPSAAGLGSDFPTGDWIVTNNKIHDNNRPNSAPSGSMAAALPAGGGVLVLGTDENQVMDNTIYNNDFYGIAVIDYCTAVTGSTFDCNVSPPAVEPYPDDNIFGKNLLVNNGTAPPRDHPFAPFAADLTDFVMDTTLGTTPGDHINRFCENAYSTKMFPEELLGQPAQSSGWCEEPTS